jgi:glycosyltransferase involved in cell wall biosynthesis
MLKKIVCLSINRFNPVLCDGVSNSTLELLRYLQSQGLEAGIDVFYTQEPYRQYVFRYLLDRSNDSRGGEGLHGYSAELEGLQVHLELLPHGEKELYPQSRHFLRAALEKLQEQKPDYIITQEDDLLSLFAASLAGIPGAHFFHSLAYIETFKNHSLFPKLLKKRRVFAVSRFLQQNVRQAFGIEAAPWYPIFDLGKYRVPRSPERDVLGYYSAGPHKGDEIANILVGKSPGWRFLVVGRSYSHSFRAVPPNLIYQGDQPDTSRFYGAIGILLVPSLVEEGFSRVILEAAVNGIPVIASRLGGIPEALGRSGIMVDIDRVENPDIQALGRRYLNEVQSLINNEDEYRRLSLQASARAEEYRLEQEEQSRRNYERFFKPYLS